MSDTAGPGPTVEKIPEGDNRPRLVCEQCGYIRYDNPKIVVGAVCTWEGRILLCRRGIAPRIGFWTVPAGFMELSESLADGAAREVAEETGARIAIESLIGVYEIPHISQVHMIYRARMLAAEIGPGDETTEVGLFDWDDIPWDALAFPSNAWALRSFRAGGPPVVHTAPETSLERC